MHLLSFLRKLRQKKVESKDELEILAEEIKSALTERELQRALERFRIAEKKVIESLTPELKKKLTAKQAIIAGVRIRTEPFLKKYLEFDTRYFGKVSRFYRDADVIEQLERRLGKLKRYQGVGTERLKQKAKIRELRNKIKELLALKFKPPF